MTDIRPRQLTLGELIALLEAEDPERIVPVGFANPHSYRGYYEQLAFEPAERVTIGHMLYDARFALGHTFEGWKGGDFTMGAHTEVWLAEQGSTGESIGAVFLSFMLEEG